MKISKHCPHCGSKSISMDTISKWDEDAQEWEVLNDLFLGDCTDCDGEFDKPVDKELPT